MQYLPWILFISFVLFMLFIDLTLVGRKGHGVRFKEAIVWSCVWITLSILFSGIIYRWHGRNDAILYLTGYLIEWSLSIDNLFVFLVIFSYFHVPPRFQHRILFWGIAGALVMRAAFISIGIALVQFKIIVYLFGLFLIYTGIQLVFQKESKVDPEHNFILRLARRFLPMGENNEKGSFFTRNAGKLFVTPLFVVLLIIETTDVMFAIDSIPAILSITTNPFLVYTSNIFAILGLRSLFFVLSGFMQLFHYLHYGLAFILSFVGVKMLISHFVEIPPLVSLGIVVGALAIAVLASVLFPKKETIE
jgi:tellurite resistance protein TerC